MIKGSVLIVSEDKLFQKSIYEMLCESGYAADMVESGITAFSFLEDQMADIVVTDIKSSAVLELLKNIKGMVFRPEVIVLASSGSVENAVELIKKGAFDYLVKPVEDIKLLASIDKALAKRNSNSNKSIIIKKIMNKDDTFYGLVGRSQKITEVYSIIEKIANSRATVLIRGESGTGKRMIAKAIHMADKKRRDKPFMEISCGALPREIIESELFGHTKGAFTGAVNDRKGRFELAHGGTLTLDDIDAFSPDLQVKLLRVLQDKEFERVGENKTLKVDVRVIVSTNQDLEKFVADKKFREDLYYRLNVISIYLPPLRDRKEDLPALVDHFIEMFSRENNKKIECVSGEALEILQNYNWPGNIRELENIIERAVILDTDGRIEKEDLPEILRNSTISLLNNVNVVTDILGAGIPASLKSALQEPEKVYILRVLKEVGGNKKKAAIKLGVNRTTLYNKLRKYNLISYLDVKAK